MGLRPSTFNLSKGEEMEFDFSEHIPPAMKGYAIDFAKNKVAFSQAEVDSAAKRLQDWIIKTESKLIIETFVKSGSMEELKKLRDSLSAAITKREEEKPVPCKCGCEPVYGLRDLILHEVVCSNCSIAAYGPNKNAAIRRWNRFMRYGIIK